MKLRNIILALFLIITLHSGCNFSAAEMSNYEIAQIKRKYSKRVINYFYEIAYYQDYKGKRDKLAKWDRDVEVYLEGTLWRHDSLYIDRAIKEINTLNLPIEVSLTDDKAAANLYVYFGNFDYLENKLDLKDYKKFRGIGVVRGSLPVLVGIANNARSYAELSTSDQEMMRESIILEELSQTLGLYGDSWKYPESIFFEGKKKVVHFNE